MEKRIYGNINSRVLLTYMKVKVAQFFPTVCNPMDCSLPGSSVCGILQARILEWFAISFFKGSSQTRTECRSPALQAQSLPSNLYLATNLKIILQISLTFLFHLLQNLCVAIEITAYWSPLTPSQSCHKRSYQGIQVSDIMRKTNEPGGQSDLKKLSDSHLRKTEK